MLPNIIVATNRALDEYVQSQTQIKQRDHIQNTLQGLVALQKQCSQIAIAYELLQPHLVHREKLPITLSIRNISSRLKNSSAEFNKEAYQQARDLSQIASSVKSLHDNLTELWLVYAQDKMRTYQELARIARTLPQMNQSIPQIDKLIHEMASATKNLPTMSSWSMFHSQLQRLAELLDDIQGLPQEKRELLQLISDGKATLKDITPDLLKWCREIGLSDSLVLRFDNAD